MAQHEVYCLPFGAGFGDDAFVGAYATDREAQDAKLRDAHTRVDQADLRACLCCYVIRPSGEVWDATLEKRLAALKEARPLP